jgi:hypothetical protein
MSRVRPVRIRPRSAITRLAQVLAVGVATAGWSIAFAQQAGDLRGPLPPQRDPLVRDLAEIEEQSRMRPYQPVSPGALPAKDTDLQLDRAAGNLDPLGGAQTPRRPVSPNALPERVNSLRQGEEAPAERRVQAGQAGSRQIDVVTTGTVAAGSVDSLDRQRNTALQPQAERASAIETLQRQAEDDPYQPTGIRIGTFILRPSLEQGVEWTSNATGTAGGGSDFLSESTLRLNAASDWVRHAASLDAFGTYRTSITGSGFSDFRGGVDARLNLDLGNQFTLESALGYQRRPEDASSPAAITGTVGRPVRETLTGSLGLSKDVGKLRFAATGNATRNTFGDALLATGGTLSQADRNQTLYALTLRGGYEISPALTPFVEVEYGRRIYDNTVDSGGYRRSANRYGLRAGTGIDLGEKLNGELSLGWIRETPDDDRLYAISGLSVAGNLLWSPIRGTTVTLTGSTEVEGATAPGAAGSILYSSALSVSRELRANLTGTATFGVNWRDYAGTSDREMTLSAEASLVWWLNRHAGVRARARHEQTTSTITGRDAKSTSIYLGLTMRR